MPIFIFVGALLLVFSALFFFAPSAVIKLSELGNKLIFTDHGSVAHRKISGTVLLFAGVLIIYLSLRF